MAGPAAASTLREALVPHEPEALPLSAVFKNSWRIFTKHLRLLLTMGFLTAVIPLLVVLVLTAIFGPIVKPPTGHSPIPGQWGSNLLQNKHHGGYIPAPAPHGAWGPSPAPGPSTPPVPKVNPISLAVSTILNLLLSSGAHVALVAVVVYVVLGDFAGRKPGSAWGAVKGSFWRLLGTDIVATLVTIVAALVLGAIVGVIGGLVLKVFFKGASRETAATTISILYLIIELPIIIFLAISLAFADQATAAEGSRVWGFRALKRSWLISKGSRGAILAVIILGALVSIILGSPLEILVNDWQEGTTIVKDWWQILVTVLVALVVLLLAVFLQAFLQVVWVVLYLSARKKAEPDFRLSAFDHYFDGETSAPDYQQARSWDP